MEEATKLADIAKALDLSVSTVSRAISGKGRISEETVKRVQDYMNGHDYRPNMLAKGLANGRCYTLCAVLPSDAVTGQIPFFYECLMGICSSGMKKNYTTMIVTDREGSTDRLLSAVSMGKADGYVLLRASEDDPALRVLLERESKIVVVGNPGIKGVPYVDEDHKGICRGFAESVIRRGYKRPAAIIGDLKYNVNKERRNGFMEAAESMGVRPLVFEDEGSVKNALQKAVEAGADCIFCGDDSICVKLLEEKNRPYTVSFYFSDVLASSKIEAPRFDARGLGKRAADMLIKKIEA